MPSKAKDNVFSKEERAAVAATARERKAASGDPEQERAEGLAMLQESLAKMPPDDRAMGERIHELVSKAVPELVPGTYYGMPAYKTPGKNGRTIGFYKAKSKFKVRYSTFGFQPDAKLDDGEMWPTEFAVIKLTPAVEAKLVELVKKGAG
ncbi:MAG TPA: hypothetical protein VJ850_14105 [Candidatus Limnocylindrales bacterium]|nr:hypothetical protein [Candidatus Limnocylindrales bacterium]